MTSTRRPLLFRTVAVALVATLVACGGAAPEAQAPRAMAPGPEPATIEEAQAQIAEAQAALGGGGATAATGTTPADAAPPAPPPPPPPAPATPDSSRSDAKKSAPGSGGVESQCSSPCRALASMRRAVTALCRMTGDEDPRCRDARKTLQSSEARVTPCAC